MVERHQRYIPECRATVTRPLRAHAQACAARDVGSRGPSPRASRQWLRPRPRSSVRRRASSTMSACSAGNSSTIRSTAAALSIFAAASAAGSSVAGKVPASASIGTASVTPAGASALRVQHAASCDREHIRTEAVLAALELRQRTRDLEPDLGGDVLGVLRLAGVEVPQECGLQGAIEARDGPLLARLGGAHHAGELVTEQDTHHVVTSLSPYPSLSLLDGSTRRSEVNSGSGCSRASSPTATDRSVPDASNHTIWYARPPWTSAIHRWSRPAPGGQSG